MQYLKHFVTVTDQEAEAPSESKKDAPTTEQKGEPVAAPKPNGTPPAVHRQSRRDSVLDWVEFGFIMAIAVWTAVGMIHYMLDTCFRLNGLLTLLDQNWKGVLLLTGVLFFRTLKLGLLRMKLKTPLGDFEGAEFGTPKSYQSPGTDEHAK